MLIYYAVYMFLYSLYVHLPIYAYMQVFLLVCTEAIIPMPVPVTDESKGKAHKLGQCQNLIAVHIITYCNVVATYINNSMNPILMSYPLSNQTSVLENGP